MDSCTNTSPKLPLNSSKSKNANDSPQNVYYNEKLMWYFNSLMLKIYVLVLDLLYAGFVNLALKDIMLKVAMWYKWNKYL